MHSAIYTDEVTIISVATDVWGKTTTSQVDGIRARVYEKNKLLGLVNGKEVFSEMQVMVPKGTTVMQGDKLSVQKIAGIAYPMASKEWQIMKIGIGHAMMQDFIELWLGM